MRRIPIRPSGNTLPVRLLDFRGHRDVGHVLLCIVLAVLPSEFSSIFMAPGGGFGCLDVCRIDHHQPRPFVRHPGDARVSLDTKK